MVIVDTCPNWILHPNSTMFMPLDRLQLNMHFLENSMFILNAYSCRELRFVACLGSKLRFLLRNTGVDSDFTQNF